MLMQKLRVMLTCWILTVALYAEGWPSCELTSAAMLGFLLSPAGGWVTVAPRNITGSLGAHMRLGMYLGTFYLKH